MFKKTKIAAATVALLGAAAAHNASAAAYDESGVSAQVLIFPYYNVNNNFISMFNVRNTKNEYKAVKIRFRESFVSNDVLDYNVYMSPYDHYSFTLSRTATGGVLLRTADATCTYPTLPAEGKEFLDAYDATSTSDLREGYIEVIEMGVVQDGDVDPVTSGTQSLYTGLKHVPPRPAKPANCGVVATAWASGYFTQGGALKTGAAPVVPHIGTPGVTDSWLDGGVPSKDINNFPTPGVVNAANAANYWLGTRADDVVDGDGVPDHIKAPTGGLAGYSGLLSLTDGVIYADNATPVRNYQTQIAQHYRSDDEQNYLLPSLASGNVINAVVQNANGTGADYDLWSGVAADFSLVDPNLSPNNGVPSGINPFPISDVLAATGLHNDYLMSPDILAATDWVITFPMRKHGIFNNYRYDGQTTTARQANKSNPKADVVNFVYVGNDVQFTYKAYDREEQIPTLNVGFSPAVKGDKSLLPREANVIQWNYEGGVASNGVLGTPTDSAIKLTIQAGYTEGWAQLTYVAGTYAGNYLTALANAGWTSTTSIPAWVVGSYTSGVYGVPSIGFAAIKAGSGQFSVGETISHVFTTN